MKMFNLFFSSVIVLIILIPGSDLVILNADQNIMQSKCTKCHGLREPDKYTKEEWKYNVERMASRAGLSEKEIQNIIDLNKKK